MKISCKFNPGKYRVILSTLRPMIIEATSAEEALHKAADVALSKNYDIFIKLYDINVFKKHTMKNNIIYVGSFGMPALKKIVKEIVLIESDIPN